MYTSRHLPGTFSSASGAAFIRRALVHHARRGLKRRVLAIARPQAVQMRNSASVRSSYDSERGYTLERLDHLSFEELVYGSADRFDQWPPDDFVLVNDRVAWAPVRTSRGFLVEAITQAAAAAPQDGTVIEFGSGNGRNLLHLKSRFPERRFAGYELSPVSVDLARALSARFKLPVEFTEANASEPLPAATAGSADVVFSAHALEMMPRIFPAVIDNMLRTATRHVFFFEPVPELWPNDVRGLASKLRAYAMDRLRGFMPVLEAKARSQGWRIAEAHRLGTSTNPINETALVHLVRNS